MIVDLQNGFMELGAAAEIPEAREIVPNVSRISAAVCAAGRSQRLGHLRSFPNFSVFVIRPDYLSWDPIFL